MVRKISAVGLSLWGWVCLGIAAYYTYLYYSNPLNPIREECWEGVGLGLGFGLITWLGLPTLTIMLRKEFGRTFSAILNIPVVLAFICLSWFLFHQFCSAASSSQPPSLVNRLTSRSTRTPPALPSALSQLLAISAPLSASVQVWPVTFVR